MSSMWVVELDEGMSLMTMMTRRCFFLTLLGEEFKAPKDDSYTGDGLSYE